ncbi:MAG: hypothetical protein E6K60_11115 [Nitrospirae bacterium]|nr:MAG: hypothetical protein E6K60_11115 [Nitrospirota bacterium]
MICRQFGVKRVYQSEAERSIEGRRSSKNHTERIKRSRHQSDSQLTGHQSGGAFALDRAGSGRHSRAVMSGGRGIGICAGAYLVGKKCAVVMQNGGFFNSNNAIVSTLLQYQIPLLLMIYYAGDIGDRTFSTSGGMTEPVLNAMGIRFYTLRELAQAKEVIQRAQVLAEDSKRPVALLLTKEVLGRRPAAGAI